MTSLEKTEENFMCSNSELKELILPNLTKVGDYFLCKNSKLLKVDLPRLKSIGSTAESVLFPEKSEFLNLCTEIKELRIPKMSIYKRLEETVLLNNGKILDVNDSKSINKKDIAELSKETGITTSELSFGQKKLNKIKTLFKRKENKQRGEE